MFHSLANMVQFFPPDSVTTVRFPDKDVTLDSKLKVVKCILEDMFNSMHGKRRVNGEEMNNRFWDDSIENPGDEK